MTQSARFQTLDAFRGVAALAIAIFHFPLIFWGSDFSPLRNAYLATNLFFALSGFILMAAYGSRLSSWGDVGRFAKKRAIRLVPLHLVATGAVVLVPYVAHISDLFLTYIFTGGYAGTTPPLVVNAKELVVHTFLLQGFGLLPSLVLNFPAWSLGVIFLCSLLLSVAVRLTKGAAWVLFALIVLTCWHLVVNVAPHHMSSTYDFGFARGALFFFTGAVAYKLSASLNLRERLGNWTPVAQALVIVGAGAFATLASAATLLSLWAPVFFVVFLCVFAVDKGEFARHFRHGRFTWLSERSYSLFMCHAFLLFVGVQAEEWIKYFKLDSFNAGFVGTAALALYVVLLLGLANLAYRYLEVPVRNRFGR